MSRLSVYGYHPVLNNGQARAIVAAPSWAAAHRAFDAVHHVSMRHLKLYGGITGNPEEMKAALAQPGVVLARPIDGRGQYLPLNDQEEAQR